MPFTIENTARESLHLPDTFPTLLDAYLQALDDQLPGQAGGLYLYGSAAQNGYHPRFSDIDLICVLNAALTESELERLDGLHAGLRASTPGARLEVHYLQWDDLGRDPQDIQHHPFYDGAQLVRRRRHVSPFVWWDLKHHCLTLRGPLAEDLPFEISWQAIQAWDRMALESYWSNWTRRPRNLAGLLQDDVVCWSVLGICRVYHNLREEGVLLKEQAGEYVLPQVPPERQKALREALRIRAGEDGSQYHSRLGRAVDAARFIRYLGAECQKIGDTD